MKKIVMLLAIFTLLGINNVKGEPMTITDGKTVKMDYTLTVDGKVVDSSKGKAPLEYVQGKKMIIPGLEKQMEGLKAGDEKKVVVPAEEAYGPVNPKAIVEIPRKNLSADVKPKLGMVLSMTGKDGKAFSGVVKEIKDDSLVLDFNHPLAGKELTFDIKVVDVK